jgi:putative oxidoreductase
MFSRGPRVTSAAPSARVAAGGGPEDVLLLLARLALATLFVPCGLGKLADLAGFAAEFERLGVPFATALAPANAGVELLGGLALALGAWTRGAALLLAASTVAVTLLVHGGFWAVPTGQGAAQTAHFVKNLAIVGGLLAVAAAGAGRFGVDGLLVGFAPGRRQAGAR